MNADEERLRGQAEVWGLQLDSGQMDLLTRYAGMLSAYDRANVIGTREVSEILVEHVLDSLSCLLFEPMKTAESLVDVGSGGGLPGLALSIALPVVLVALIESNGKKVDFLEYVVDELGLESSGILNARAEDLGHQEGFRGRYEIATARALAPLAVLAEYCLPFVRVGGYIVAMKGRLSEEEMKGGEAAVEVLGGEIERVITVPFERDVRSVERHLVILRKNSETPTKYPRRAGVPKKRPLGPKK